MELKPKSFNQRDDDLKKPLHDEILRWVDNNFREILQVVFPKYSEDTEVIKTTWQTVVRQDAERGPIVGILDMYVSVGYEREVTDQPQKWKKFYSKANFAVIVRTEIPSLGELMREIRLCKAGHAEGVDDYTFKHSANSHFIVVCPDDHDAEKLKEQGIQFFKYKLGSKR